jgi:hypothetical protein
MDAVLLLASRDYMNYQAVLAVVNAIPRSTTIQVTGYRTGIGHTLISTSPSVNIEAIKWKPTRPDQTCTATRALLFWDGTPDMAILRSLILLRRIRIPIEIYDANGNSLDLATFCARLTHSGGNNGKMSTAPKPPVIVDAPLVSPGELWKRATKVRLTILLPEDVAEKYDEQAKHSGHTTEKICADRLRTCVTYTSGRGLYFDDRERSELEHITGGHYISDAAAALARIKTTVTLKVGDISIELTDRVLARCSSRAKSERKTLEEYVKKEVIQGLERSVGLRPY